MQDTQDTAPASELNRAIDLGYGWTKVATGNSEVKSFQSLPWRNPKVVHGAASAKVMTVNYRDTLYGVSDEPETAAPRTATRVRGDGYIDSETYAVCMAAAVKMMRVPKLKRLVVGTPVGNYADARKALQARFGSGISFDATHVPVERLQVVQQPIGGLAYHLHASGGSVPLAVPRLLIDVGYGTLDWVLAVGAKVNASVSGSSSNGVARFVDMLIERITGDSHGLGQDLMLVSAVDRMVTQGVPFRFRGEQQFREAHQATIDALAAESFLEVLHRVGSLDMCESILLMGGGATLYQAAVTKAANGIPVEVVRDPHLANIRGFQLLADNGVLDRQ